jgi:hypothetical protein
MIIQTIGLDPSGSVWTDAASNVSSLDPSGADQIDAEHPARNRKVVGSNPTSGSTNQQLRVHIAVGTLAVVSMSQPMPLSGSCTRRRSARTAMGVSVGPTTLPSKSTSPATGVRLAGSWAVTVTGMPDAHGLRQDLELAGHLGLMHAGGEQLNSRLAALTRHPGLVRLEELGRHQEARRSR